jgi:hypothetical protein
MGKLRSVWLSLLVGAGVQGQDISFTPDDGPGVLSEAFEQVLPGGIHTTEYIDFGVDFSGLKIAAYAGPDSGWSFVDSEDILTLNHYVGGRIVVPGTTKQGTTDLLWVEADLAESTEQVQLACWDAEGKFLGTSFADAGVGEDGDLVAKFEHPGIASFMLWEHDDGHGHEHANFGLRRIHLNTPVPEPGAAAVLGCAAMAGRRRRG